tara:strand:+ start:1901 stop:2125 length:225 start_codon:yes stop_codon:yes gene_type:complete
MSDRPNSIHLTSYPFLKRGNYQFKISVVNKTGCLVVGNHVQKPKGFFVRYFADLDTALFYLDFLIEKDYRDTYE